MTHVKTRTTVLIIFSDIEYVDGLIWSSFILVILMALIEIDNTIMYKACYKHRYKYVHVHAY